MSEPTITALEAIRNALGTMDEIEAETPPDPYVADARGFAVQAGVCLEKSLAGHGIEIPPDPNKPEPAELPPMPIPEMEAMAEPEETSRDRDQTS